MLRTDSMVLLAGFSALSPGLILSMDEDLIVMELNVSAIYVLPTDLSLSAGVAPARQVKIVSWTRAVEGNLFEDEPACDTRREGNRLLLVMPGGSGQLVSFSRDAMPTRRPTTRPRGFENGH